MNQTSLSGQDGGGVEGASYVPVSLPRLMIKELRRKAKDYEVASQAKRRESRELEVRASEMFDAFISFDLLADKMEQALDDAIAQATPNIGEHHVAG